MKNFEEKKLFNHIFHWKPKIIYIYIYIYIYILHAYIVILRVKLATIMNPSYIIFASELFL
ncbi:hypothetical protein ACMBCM_04760 [Spiroplasma sp. K1]